MRIRPISAAFSLAAILFVAAPAKAVIRYGSPERNTSAPTGRLDGSGWQYQGRWAGFLGTPIAPSYFLAAKHIGGTVGDIFTLDGVGYRTVSVVPSPASDLNIWKVDGTFPRYASLYETSDERDRQLVVHGTGTQRGGEVRVGGILKGWTWGEEDRVQSWGTNAVEGIVDGGTSLGSLLRFAFDARGGADEAILSSGDSGGGVFILIDGVWRLAGMNYGVDGPFSLVGGSDGGFMGAIFDARGLYTGGAGGWQYVSPRLRKSAPASSYATRISSNLAFIRSVIGP